MEDTINRIENFADQDIRDIVFRISDDYLPMADRDMIFDGLLYRKSRVRASLKAIYGGIP